MEPPAASKCSNPYSSKVVTIAIGGSKFGIHTALLESLTCFFDKHGRPASIPSPQGTKTASDIVTEGMFFPMSGDGGTVMKSEAENADGGGIGTKGGEPADFVIVDRIHNVAAFKIFTDWLYNKPPETLCNQLVCRILLQAYVLSREYKAYALQNVIADRFRDFHTRNPVQLENLMWLANRIGDNISCPLTAYFVKQIAFEIASEGFDHFEATNGFTKVFLQEGVREVRFELFKVPAEYAHVKYTGKKAENPALFRAEKWHVQETGENAGQLMTNKMRRKPT